MTAGKESTGVMVEHPSTQVRNFLSCGRSHRAHSSVQEGESLIFTGTEEPAKELDCVLIYDEETGVSAYHAGAFSVSSFYVLFADIYTRKS